MFKKGFNKNGLLITTTIGSDNKGRPMHAYEWNDINIQNGIGNTVIDLSQTILPKGMPLFPFEA